jgi:hypothetical protein
VSHKEGWITGKYVEGNAVNSLHEKDLSRARKEGLYQPLSLFGGTHLDPFQTAKEGRDPPDSPLLEEPTSMRLGKGEGASWHPPPIFGLIGAHSLRERINSAD